MAFAIFYNREDATRIDESVDSSDGERLRVVGS